MGGPERKSQATGRRMDVWVRGLPRTSVLASVLCELSTARPQGSENVPEPDTSAGTRRLALRSGRSTKLSRWHSEVPSRISGMELSVLYSRFRAIETLHSRDTVCSYVRARRFEESLS